METTKAFNMRIVLLVGAVLLVLVIAVVVLSTKKPEPQPQTATVKPTSEFTEPRITSVSTNLEVPTNAPVDASPEVFMGTDFITVTTPGNWQATKDTIPNGERVLLMPKNSSVTPRESVSIVSEAGVNQNALNSRAKIYEDLEYEKRDRTVRDFDAVEYRGVLPVLDSKDPKNPDILQNVVIFVSAPGKLYTITYHYISREPDLEIESRLEDLVSTIDFK